MIDINYHFLDVKQTFDYYDSDRSNFQRIYAKYLSAEPAIGGRVLDIGCGHEVNPTLKIIAGLLGQLDGVDPFPVVIPPSHLVNRWTCSLEDLPVAPSTYDMAYSYTVVEHVKDIQPFLKKAIDVIKHDGIYWSLSPNSRHPFTWITRLIQRMGLKHVYRAFINQQANDYPAYYKLSNDVRIIRAIREMKLPVSRIDFYYIPNVHWDTYFPKKLRIIPHILDRMILLRKPRASFFFMFRIKKASAVVVS